jgi:threonine/homoserine/homoserine lactone efflux protein
MLGTQHLALFVVSGLLLNVTPGQDTFYIVGRTIAQGRATGIVSVLGITSGALVHTLMAAFGLSAIFAASATAFLIVKLAGALYLTYLGLRMMLARDTETSVTAFTPESNTSIYRAAFLTNLLNPKVALFFLAFLPQFVAPAANSRVVTMLFLGLVFVFNGTLWSLILVWGSSFIGRRLGQRGRALARARKGTGVLFVALGLRLAATD